MYQVQQHDCLAQKWFAQVLAKAHVHGKQTRVVVTGQGVVSSLGQTVDEFYNNLLEVMDSAATMVDLFSILPVIFPAMLSISHVDAGKEWHHSN